VCICGSILLLPLCRLDRAALNDRPPNPAHVRSNERDHRTGVPPSAHELIPEIKFVVAILPPGATQHRSSHERHPWSHPIMAGLVHLVPAIP